MIKKSKRTGDTPEGPAVKRKKLNVVEDSVNKTPADDSEKHNLKGTLSTEKNNEKKNISTNKISKFSKKINVKNYTKTTNQHFRKGSNNQPQAQEKPDWNKLKKEKKDLRLKRKKSKHLYDVTIEVKKITENLRQKELTGGKAERSKLINQVHTLLRSKGHYAKFALTHDMARIVQYLLKFGSETVRNSIAEELIPVTVDMLQSKYGRYCLKNMLKYGNTVTRTACIKAMYGNAIKLTSHTISAAIFEYTYSTWASPQQKQHLIQEFFGDIYKRTKDNNVKHLRDVYKDSSSMKNAALQATKANLSRVLNKDLLDSGLIQSVLYQYLTECGVDDRTELINQLAPHVVVLSNSKDGARVAMKCIWHGTNKDRKLAMKAIKEHVIDLSKHEHGHCSVITLLDTADDTVLLNKMLLSQILLNIEDLAGNEWGRKVLLWLVAPGDSTYFHPVFIKELEAGRQEATCKKVSELRRTELLNYIIPGLLQSLKSNPKFWLSTASIAMLTIAILKSGNNTETALEEIAKTITIVDWKVNEKNKEIAGIEHAGLHMALKKLAQHDNKSSFATILLNTISDETIKSWLQLNRGCFLLVAVYENGTEEFQEKMKQKLSSQLKFLKKQTSKGAKLLVTKLS